MKRACWHPIFTTLMVAMTAGSRAMVEGAHGAAHHALSHDEGAHHHHDSDLSRVAPSAEARLDHAEPGHLHFQTDHGAASTGLQLLDPPVITAATVIPPIATVHRMIVSSDPILRPPIRWRAKPPGRAPPVA